MVPVEPSGHPVSMTPRTPQPQQPKKKGTNWVSWIIFLLILARPLWGVIRSIAPPSISSQQILMVVGGVVALGVVLVIAARVRDGSLPSSQPSIYQPSPSSQPSIYQQPSTPQSPTPYRPPRSTISGAPTFEPIITGTVVLVGIVVAAIIGGVIALITVLT